MFDGYRVIARYNSKSVMEDNQETFIPTSSETLPAQDGSFVFEIPTQADRQGDVVIQVIDRTGLTAGQARLPQAGPFSNIGIEVSGPSVTFVTSSNDITLGSHMKYSGRAIDPKGKAIESGFTVVIWATTGDGAPIAPVSVTTSGTGGYFSEAWPPQTFIRAYAVVSGGKPIDIPLENNRLPLRMIIVVEDELKHGEEAADDCECSGVVTPRLPDAIDLVNNNKAYASDSKACVDFTIPNRTVEEVAYQAIVRTTQPEIKGAPRTRPNPIPIKILDKLAQLAGSKPGEILIAVNEDVAGAAANENINMISARAGAIRRTSFNEVLAVNPEAIKLMENVLAKAKKFSPGIELDNEMVSGLTEDEAAETILKERIRTKTPMRLESSVLLDIAKETTDLTPRRLLQAEQVSVVRKFREKVGQLVSPAVGRYVLTAEKQMMWDESTDFGQAVGIAHGHLLTFKQVWKADGYSLGDLLYSLPLAPGQQKRISILDWSMTQVSSRRASRTVTENLEADLSRDRDVQEIIRASLSENMEAKSSARTTSVGGGIAGFIGPLVFGAAGGVSNANSTASQTSGREVTGSALNKIRDRTLQSASAVRSQRATVVQETKQGESVTAQTEVLANYNHCHAMTVEYFEVLRHFQVSQEIAQVQECLFVPFAITPFNLSKVQRWKDPLRRYLRDRTHAEAFDAVDRVLNNWLQADYPIARYADERVRYMDGEFWIRMKVPRPKDKEDGKFESNNWTGYETNGLLWDTAERIWERYLGIALEKDRQRIWDERIAPAITQRLLDSLTMSFIGSGSGPTLSFDATLVSRFAQDRNLLVSFRITGIGIWTRAQIERIRFAMPFTSAPPGLELLVDSGTMNYRTDHINYTLFSNRRIVNDLLTGDPVEIAVPLTTFEKRNPRERDRRMAERLVDHLNEHIEYYHRGLWYSMDPNRRFLLLDGFIAPDAGGRSVASVVENRIIGIVGNSLIMPVAPGKKLDTTYEFAEATPEDLRHLYSTDPSPSARISVPTSGVFAEAVIGKCNSCEQIDDTKFWRWEDAPIPDQPTLIAPLSTESRRRPQPSLAPDQLADPIVKYQQIPDAPDPTGLAAAMRALGTNNIFKDLTGVALNQQNAINALKSSIKVGQEFATKAGALAQQKFLNKELDRSIQQIKSAKDKKLITEDQAKSLTESALRGAIGGKKPQGEAPSKSEEVQKAMKRVPGAGKGSIRVTRPDGTVEVTTENGTASSRINVTVNPPVAFMKQTSNSTCWAAGVAMMISWKKSQSTTIESALNSLNGEWFNKYQRDEKLTATEFRGLMAAAGLIEEGPKSYSPEGLSRLMQGKGPLLEVGDDAIAENYLVHVRILTGMKGDGSAEKTTVTLIDADTGVQTIAYTVFDQRHGAKDVVNTGLGIFHF